MEKKKNKEKIEKDNVVASETMKIPVVDLEEKNNNIEENIDNEVNVEKAEQSIINENESTENVEVVEENEKSQDDDELEQSTNEEENKNIVTTVKEKKLSKKMIALISVICILVSLLIAFGVIVCINKLNNNVYSNIYSLSTNLSDFNSKQVEELIDKENEKLNKEIIIDIYQNEEKLKTINSSEIELKINKEETVKNIFGYGRNSNIFVNNFNILKALIKGVNIQPEYVYNVEKLEEILKNIDIELDGRFVEDSYNVDEVNKKLIIKKGKSGIALNYDKVKEDIINSIIKCENTEIVVSVNEKNPAKTIAQEVYEKVKREPKDASVDTSKKPIEIVNEVYGIEFNVSELQAMLDKKENQAEATEIEFSLNFVEPKVKLRDLSYDLCLDKICGLTTYFDAYQTGRSNNIRVALSYLNDQIIMPGETFSYNAVVGDTTTAKGYMAAAIFKGGRVVNEIGGGICQTSSTLYNVALMADLQIVERYAHGLPVGYVKPSLDATVYGDVLDFKFKNTRNYPIKIVTSYSNGGEMNISLYGTREEVEYDISLVSTYLYTVNYKTEYIQDSSLAAGEQQVVYNGVNGYASEAYLIKKLNGQTVETRYLSKDVYNAQTKTVRVGITSVTPPQGQS